jgi:hypothetical protein
VGLIFKFLGIPGIVGLVASIYLGTLLALQTHKTHIEHASAVSWQQKYQGEHGALLQTIINYSQAAAQARADDAANKVRVQSEAAAISHERQTSYEARIDDARARAQRVRVPDGSATANQSSPGAAPVSGVPGPSGGPNGPAPQTGLPADDALTATEQAIQLDELERWVAGVIGIDVNQPKSR